jgi:hypothetical protein
VPAAKAARPAALALVTACLLAACGSGNKPGTVSAGSYASQVCTSVGTWLRGIEASSAQISRQLRGGSTSQNAKRALEALVGSAVADSERVVDSLRAAGVPDVSNGKTISASLIGAFEHATAELQTLKGQVAHLSTEPARFRAGALQLSASLQRSLGSIGSGLASLHSPALQKAAGTSAACRNLGAGS